ncbi:MAG: cysteine-rich CWC family protein [Gammaproteobacteria bacterium]
MRKHEQKRCPRCQALFECKSGSILLCHCQTVFLESEHLDYVSERYTDCLCAACLKAVRMESDNERLTGKIVALTGNKWR